MNVLAESNGIEDPDKIFAGRFLNLDSLRAPGAPMVRSRPASQWLYATSAQSPASVGNGAMRVGARLATGDPSNPPTSWSARAGFGGTTGTSGLSATQSLPGVGSVLDRTLDRAVERGYIAAEERGAVRDRVLDLSRKYKFSPDDFATVALMESDGLNPQATNGRCHGIIQFCDGPNRGAASVGMGDRAQDIKGRSVLEQFDLVDRYFEDTGLRDFESVSLVDLYLTILTPAARRERRPDAALEIAGTQAQALYSQGDRSQPMTRRSISAGLQANAAQRLTSADDPARSHLLRHSMGRIGPGPGLLQSADPREPTVDPSLLLTRVRARQG